MSKQPSKTIAVIGGGFCGTMVAVHLMRKVQQPVKIILVNKGYPPARGVAYSAATDSYLLNVRVINMSAFPAEREHFLNWIYTKENYRLIDKKLVSNIYAPRKLYGEYLTEIWQQTLEQKKEWIDVEIIDDTATNITHNESACNIEFSSHHSVTADYIVLATGNNAPKNILQQYNISSGKKYFSNPWCAECIEDVKKLKNIFIAGNGLTMIDTVLGLKQNGFSGTIHTISPNGYNLLPHKYNLLVYEKILEELPADYSLLKIFSLVKTHAKRLEAKGIGMHLVIDALRPYAQNIWQSFSLDEKNKFIKRLSPQWNALRHRIPLHIFERIQNMRIENKLVAYKGKIKAVKEKAGGMEIIFSDKNAGKERKLMVDRIINCTGPETNIFTCNNILLQNLAEKKIIAPDELRAGINADGITGAVINAEGKVSENIFTLGGSLKGILWESTAVPELRVQAQNLANVLLHKIEGASH